MWHFVLCYVVLISLFSFRNLNFLFCVPCTLLYSLNCAIYEVEPRWRRKMKERRECSYFNASVVMLVFIFKIDTASNRKQKRHNTKHNVTYRLPLARPHGYMLFRQFRCKLRVPLKDPLQSFIVRVAVTF